MGLVAAGWMIQSLIGVRGFVASYGAGGFIIPVFRLILCQWTWCLEEKYIGRMFSLRIIVQRNGFIATRMIRRLRYSTDRDSFKNSSLIIQLISP
ncbi:hypothetical protein ABKN59_003617 [Abortiporus biennis]